jgi:hypothetical protein
MPQNVGRPCRVAMPPNAGSLARSGLTNCQLAARPPYSSPENRSHALWPGVVRSRRTNRRRHCDGLFGAGQAWSRVGGLFSGTARPAVRLAAATSPGHAATGRGPRASGPARREAHPSGRRGHSCGNVVMKRPDVFHGARFRRALATLSGPRTRYGCLYVAFRSLPGRSRRALPWLSRWASGRLRTSSKDRAVPRSLRVSGRDRPVWSDKT